MHIVDSQIHLWEGREAPAHHARTPFTTDTAISEMDRAGVAKVVNCPALWDRQARAYARRAAQEHPDRIVTMDWFPLGPDADESVFAETMGAEGTIGLRFLVVDRTEISRIRTGDLDWLWSAAEASAVPVSLMLLPEHLGMIDILAGRFRKLKLAVDHLGVLPFLTLPQATSHFDTLTRLARHDNVCVKASGVPSMATDAYPFVSVHDSLRTVYRAFGAERMFWGTDITRMTCSWAECVSLFVDHLPWLRGRDLELVMGAGLDAWLELPRPRAS